MQRAPSPTRRAPSPGRERAPRAAHYSSAPRAAPATSSSSSASAKPSPPSSSSATPKRPAFSALKFAARQKVVRGDSVLQMKTESLAASTSRVVLLPDDRHEPQTLDNEEADFEHLRRQFSTLTGRHRSRWVKSKLESPCGQEWQTLLDCYLDKGAHPMLCLEEEAAMRRCKQRLVRLLTCFPLVCRFLKRSFNVFFSFRSRRCRTR